MTELLTLADIRAAAANIAGAAIRTPALPSPGLSAILGRRIVLKPEVLQPGGSFKPRGIAHKLAQMSAAERARGLLTVSGGNHGLALALMASARRISTTVIMPQAAPERSKRMIRESGAALLLAPDVQGAFALAEAEKAKGAVYVNPIGDPVLAAGFGTIGLELAEDVPDLTDVFASIGAGGMISGIATAIKALKPNVRIWGVETQGAESMTAALAAGKPVTVPITSISSTLGAPAVSAFALAHAQKYVERVLVVSDAEAVAGMKTIAEEAAFWVEPAAGCLIPAARRILPTLPDTAVVALVLCGNNASLADMRKWQERFGIA